MKRVIKRLAGSALCMAGSSLSLLVLVMLMRFGGWLYSGDVSLAGFALLPPYAISVAVTFCFVLATMAASIMCLFADIDQ